MTTATTAAAAPTASSIPPATKGKGKGKAKAGPLPDISGPFNGAKYAEAVQLAYRLRATRSVDRFSTDRALDSVKADDATLRLTALRLALVNDARCRNVRLRDAAGVALNLNGLSEMLRYLDGDKKVLGRFNPLSASSAE